MASSFNTMAHNISSKNSELARKTAMLQLTLDNMADGITLVDAELNVVLFNQKFLELLDLPAERFYPGSRYEDFIRYNAERREYGPGDVEELVREQVEQAKRFTPHCIQHTRPNGVVIEIRSSPMSEGGFVTTYTDITERKRTEEALQVSEQRFRELAERARVLPWEAAAKTWQFEYVGPQSMELLGYSQQEWYEIGFWVKHIHPEDREWVVDHCECSSATRDHYEFEYRMLSARDDVVWFHQFVNVVRDADGPRLLRGYMMDVTKRKAVEKALRESEERLRAVTDNSPAAIYLKDREGRYLLVNKQFERRHQVTAEEVRGRTIHGIVSDDLADAYFVHEREVLEKRATVHHEFQVPYPDGSLHAIMVTKFPILDEDHRLIGIGGIDTDITDKRQVAEALEASEVRFKDFAESAADWFWEMGPDLRFTYLAGGYQDVMGVSQEQILGRTHEELWLPHIDDQGKSERRLRLRRLSDLQAQRSFEDVELTWIRPDETTKVLVLAGKPLFDGNGHFQGYRGVVRDVTEHKRAEEQARLYQAELAHVARLSTMGEMASGLAHELNQPLCAIATYSDASLRMVRAGANSSEKLVHALEQTVAAAKRAGEIIRRRTGVYRSSRYSR